MRTSLSRYLDGSGPFPDRLPWLVLVGQFLLDFQLMVERWAEWSTQIVETWPDDLTTTQPDWKVLETQAAITRAHRQ
ncbi:MAG: hypothetical protein JO020_16010 [Chloroflexi bacterium]|nr:hypothetical protein [Chloroflexota bacterium]